MVSSIELQVISRILTSDSQEDINTLCAFDSSYYSVFTDQIKFILDHKYTYGSPPDPFTFQAKFPDVTIVKVTEPLSYLVREIKKNKQHILLLSLFNRLKDLGSDDVKEAWNFIGAQYDKAIQLDSTKPTDLVKDAKERAQQVQEYAKQSRIPTGFDEIDKLMYGGFSTVEELVLLVARTNTGKSWVCTRMMEAAQRAGYPVLYYSPEMQASYLGTRFDTWRGHFQNNQLHQGKYTEQYEEYIERLQNEGVSAYVIEDKDMADGEVSVPAIANLVKKYGIKEIIIDGLSYMVDSRGARGDSDYIRYKNIAADLFKLSKQYGCAVVISVQANRETKECKDDKGDPFPSLYNIEGSDHPARICTQAFSLRQVFDKHVLDIRLEKSRNANNQKPVLTYAWDINTGNMQFLPGDEQIESVITPVSVSGTSVHMSSQDSDILEDDFDEDDVEF